MIQAVPLTDVIGSEGKPFCAWPECPDRADAHGVCRKHGLRIERGGEPGCESPWDRLVRAALALADAETDADFDGAARGLKEAAVRYRRTARPRVPRVRQRPSEPVRTAAVQRDVERAKAALAARGIVVREDT